MSKALTTVTSTGTTGDTVSKLDAFKRLVEATPRDDNGFLTYLLDHTAIPSDMATRSVPQQAGLIAAAKIPLNMVEGYLSFEAIKPVWDQLRHEPDSYYEAFRLFLNIPERDMGRIQEALPNFTGEQLNDLYTFYYWKERSKACDLLRPIAAARLRDQRVISTEDAHFMVSSHILSLLSKEIEQRAKDTDGRPFLGMNAQNIIDSLAKMMTMQRVALRLPAQGGKQADSALDSPEFASPEQRMRDAVQHYDGRKKDQTAAEQVKQQLHQLIASSEVDATQVQDVLIAALNKARTQNDQQPARAPAPEDEKEEDG